MTSSKLSDSTEPTESLDKICRWLEESYPLELAEDWDNVGLLVGDRQARIRRVMTCLTLSPDVVKEAIERNADLIISHHPLPFKPLKRLISQTYEGSLLLALIEHHVAIYSPHTAFDSANQGINDMTAGLLGLANVRPLEPHRPKRDLASYPAAMRASLETAGVGRIGKLAPCSAQELLERLRQVFPHAKGLRLAGSSDKQVTKVAIACGAGGSFWEKAKFKGADALVTGEASYHQCMSAAHQDGVIVILGHHTSERFAVEGLAERLSNQYGARQGLEVWPSQSERCPVW